MTSNTHQAHQQHGSTQVDVVQQQPCSLGHCHCFILHIAVTSTDTHTAHQHSITYFLLGKGCGNQEESEQNEVDGMKKVDEDVDGFIRAQKTSSAANDPVH